MLQFLKRSFKIALLACIMCPAALFSQSTLIRTDFKNVAYGNIPHGWADVMNRQPSRNWMVDGNQFLRPVLKGQTALLAWVGTGSRMRIPVDVEIEAEFKKTEDSDVFFGLAGRIADKHNFYAVIVSGATSLRIVKVVNGKTRVLTEMALLQRYHYPGHWKISARFAGDMITGIVRDEKGSVMARADFKDETFTAGTFGIYATEYTGAASVHCEALAAKETKPLAKAGKTAKPVKAAKRSKSTKAAKTAKNSKAPKGYKPPPFHHMQYASYRLIKPASNPESLNTRFEDISDRYDVIVAGAGTGGWAAAVQAARMGKKVLLLEETDWIGGQMAAAAVTSMDEAGPEVRERGIYREYHESMVLYYYTLDKDPFQAYYYGRKTQDQQSGGAEPAVARALLYGFIEDARKSTNGGKLDLILRSRVTDVKKQRQKVTGVKITNWKENGKEETRSVACTILIDATEYGDVIPLTGAPYRVGNTKSESLDMKGAVQDHTFTGVIREYPDGIPAHLKMTTPPPGYEKYKRTYANKTLYGDWGLNKGRRMYRVALAWRGMADAKSPLRGRRTGLRHTLAGLNGGNDYLVSVATIESPEQRMADEKTGIYKTLSIIYYLQHELGANWSFAEDQGYNTVYNRMMMKKRGIVPEMLPYAKYLPQLPYVRESRRITGIKTLVADDLERGANARHFSTSIAVGDYAIDLHHTNEHLEFDLDKTNYTHKSGPFQLPFEAFIPASVDGFLPAEKNFSQSRLVSGATRLQPITMLTGQAVGMIASLAVSRHVQPRLMKPLLVQLYLLDEGDMLIPRWYTDVEWNTELWKAVQVMCLYDIMDRPGDAAHVDGMQFKPTSSWGVTRVVSEKEAALALQKLAAALGIKPAKVSQSASVKPFLSSAELESLARKTGLRAVMPRGKETFQEKITQKDLALFCLFCARTALKVKPAP